MVVVEDFVVKFECKVDVKSLVFLKVLWKFVVAAIETLEYYYVYRKGFGVVCN